MESAVSLHDDSRRFVVYLTESSPVVSGEELHLSHTLGDCCIGSRESSSCAEE